MKGLYKTMYSALAGLAMLGSVATAQAQSYLKSTPNLDGLVARQDNQTLGKVLHNWDIKHKQSEKRSVTYAVLINGNNDGISQPKHRTNIKQAYDAMKKLGVKDENTFFLTVNYHRDDNQGKYESKVNAHPTLQNVKAVFDHLEGIVDGNDSVMFYSTGHGAKSRGSIVVRLPGQDLTKERIAQFFENLPDRTAKEVVAVNCYSGDIVQELETVDSLLAVGLSAPGEKTSSRRFNRAFWQARTNKRFDIDGNKTVDAQEAYDHAIEVHQAGLSGIKDYSLDGVVVDTRKKK